MMERKLGAWCGEGGVVKTVVKTVVKRRRGRAMVAAMTTLIAAASVAATRAQMFRSYARYLTEEQAVRHGNQLGLGTAWLEGAPVSAPVNSMVELKLRFRVGPAGMQTGGGIRLATAHGMSADWGGMHTQDRDPAAEDYLTYRTSTGSPLAWKLYNTIARNPLFQRYHPWQFINEFKLTGPSLKPGDVVEINLGDRSGGGAGLRLQQSDERKFELRFYVDALGNDDYLPLKSNPAIAITAGPARELHVILPSDSQSGQPTWVSVWADDGFGNPAESYRGTLRLTGDTDAIHLPAPYTFQETDHGAHRFENLVFSKAGVWHIRAEDMTSKLAAGSNPIVTRDSKMASPALRPREKLYWGDIHTHTMYSDGRGTPAETYDFGRRISALDFTAVTDHSFLVEDWMWDEIKKTGNQFYQPGKFVTFLAYEWSGQTDVGGDHNVYTPDNDLPIIRCYSYFNYENLRMYHGPRKGANHVEDLFRMLAPSFKNENLMVIPHYGGRQANPGFHNPGLQRNIEIFSDHRRSEDWASKFLDNGYRLGIMASTDNHAGNAGFGVRRASVTSGQEGPWFEKTSPPENGTALVGVYARELTREGIFQALYHRHTYATTGTRIILKFDVNGSPMGSEIRTTDSPHIVASVEGTGPIAEMRLVKSGKIVYAIPGSGSSARMDYVDASGEYANQFYLIDVVQKDGKKAISSPVWVN
jgi:Protein of unknown function (DUF3604)